MVQHKEPNAYDKQLVALGRVLQILREEENSDVLIDTILSYLHTEFDYSLVWLGLYDRLEHRLFGKGGMTPSGENISFLKQRFLLSPGDIMEQVVIQQRPVAVPDLREELRAGEWRKAAQTFNIQGTVIFPIRYRDHCYGVTLLGSTHWGISPSSEEKARLSMILGELAAALFKIEMEWQRQQTKHPDQPMFALLSKLRSLTGLGPRLEAVVEETHQFIQPTRTSVYWFERERRYFWRRLSNRQKASGFHESNQPASGITVQEVSGFYQALLSDQVVSIGEAHSSLKADTTTRLMQQIRARSLLAAPILFQNELLGFLAVEGNEARIWTEQEKSYVRGAAQIVALTAPLDEMEATIAQIKLDQALTAEVARSIYSEEDWKSTLKQTADQVCQRLKAERFLVLLYDKDRDEFAICYQSHPGNRRPLPAALETLSESDWRLLEQSQAAIAIENLDGDLKFMSWRDRLLEVGAKALILCNTAIGRQPIEGLVMVCHETPRTWSRPERDLLRVVSQQVGVILHEWQLQKRSDQQYRITEAIQRGLLGMQQIHQLEGVERSALQQLTQVLEVPLAALVTWLPGRNAGRIIVPTALNDRFGLNLNMVIPNQTDLLIQWTLEHKGILAVTIADLPSETRQWINGSHIGQVLTLALRTSPDHQPTGMLLVVDVAERHWSEYHLAAMLTLGSQLAWSRRYLALTDRLTTQCEGLEQLNWYKHRVLEDSYRAIATNLKRLNDLGNPKDPLFMTRQQQLLRQLQDTLLPLAQLIRDEQWQVRSYSTTISLISLLKRALERVDGFFKQRQLWSQVHDETNLTLGGDIVKIELILYELLVSACQRAVTGGRIDLWCRQLDPRWFELSITDNGLIEPNLLLALETDCPPDRLAPSILDHPPGLHLAICRSLMKQIGGEFSLTKLDDGRILSRLVLPIAGSQPSGKAKPLGQSQ